MTVLEELRYKEDNLRIAIDHLKETRRYLNDICDDKRIDEIDNLIYYSMERLLTFRTDTKIEIKDMEEE